jgi:hypothetical protein
MLNALFFSGCFVITIQNLKNLVDKLAEISRLAAAYYLDDIALSKHLSRSGEKLYFVLSRKDKILSVDECGEIYVELCSLLDIERYKEEDNVVVQIKEIFNPGYFEKEYGDQFSLKASVVKEDLTSFIKNTLGLSGAPSEPEKKRRRSSNNEASESQTSANSPKRLRAKEDLKEEKPRAISPTSMPFISQPLAGALFASHEKQGNMPMNVNGLSPELQELAQNVIEKMRENPQYTDAMLRAIKEGLAQKGLVHS